MSSDPEQDYFADGITEDIITALSKWRWFFVIARNSSFTYKGRAVDVRQVGRELGVRYALEGSTRKIGGRVRITAQLIEAATGAHLWGDRFDGSLDDIFELQDKITRNIAAAIEPALARTESQGATRKPTDNMSAWDFYLRGLWHSYQLSESNRSRALACFERAIELDGELADAHAGVSRMFHGKVVYGRSADRTCDLSRAAEAARQALELDRENAAAWYALAMASSTSGDSVTAVTAARRSVELNPNFAQGYFALAVASLYHGQPEEALAAAETALRLNPNAPQYFAWLAPRASALYLLRRYDEAIETALHSLSLRRLTDSRFPTAMRVLAASYAQLGMEAQARAAVAEILESGGTERTIADVVRPFRRVADREHYAEGLHKAGLPEA